MRRLTECAYFRCRELLLSGKCVRKNDAPFTALTVLDGEGKIGGERFVAGNSYFVPCGEQFELEGEAKIILTDLPQITAEH